MVFPGLKTARLIVEAAALSGQRVLMQTATAGGDLGALAASELPPNVFHIGRCPHDWLLPKMAAVVHHGGAGTVGAGLNLGLPTLCCPFFGDQFFYAHAVAARKAGPPPIPFEALTAAKLGRALADLCDPSYAEHARRVMEGIRAENGLEGGLADFNRHLPLRDMVCDVSTLLGERCLGRHYYPSLRIKVSDEVHKTLASSAAVDRRLLDGARPHATREWRLGGHVRGPCSGALTGALAFVWELLDGVISLVSLPIKSACYHPVSCVHGFVLGAVAALVLVVLRLLYAPIICLDRFATGFANCCTPAGAGTATYDGAAKPVDHVLDPEPALTAISQAARGNRCARRTTCAPTAATPTARAGCRSTAPSPPPRARAARRSRRPSRAWSRSAAPSTRSTPRRTTTSSQWRRWQPSARRPPTARPRPAAAAMRRRPSSPPTACRRWRAAHRRIHDPEGQGARRFRRVCAALPAFRLTEDLRASLARE